MAWIDLVPPPPELNNIDLTIDGRPIENIKVYRYRLNDDQGPGQLLCERGIIYFLGRYYCTGVVIADDQIHNGQLFAEDIPDQVWVDLLAHNFLFTIDGVPTEMTGLSLYQSIAQAPTAAAAATDPVLVTRLDNTENAAQGAVTALVAMGDRLSALESVTQPTTETYGEKTTGRTWVDGKPIHRRIINTASSGVPLNWQPPPATPPDIDVASGLNTVVSMTQLFKMTDGSWVPGPFHYNSGEMLAWVEDQGVVVRAVGPLGVVDYSIVVEYTKP